MIYLQTGSECGENEAVRFSRTFSFVFSASTTLTCVYFHSTVRSGQAACGMVRWMGGRPMLLFLLLFFYIIYCMYIHLFHDLSINLDSIAVAN